MSAARREESCHFGHTGDERVNCDCDACEALYPGRGFLAKATGGPLLDPLAMPPEELARLRAEGYGHLIAKPRRMDDVPGYRRDW